MLSLAFLTAGLLASTTLAQFNPLAKTNVAVYWGQGPNQLRLLEHCKRPALDIINIGFINQFPNQTGDELPGSNFGNACYANVYTDAEGNPSKLYSQCPNIGPDITACQQTYGKKILLSIGGDSPTNQFLASDSAGLAFADFLWGAFGPVNASWTGPRPFGSAVVDGFDFDIESNIATPLPATVPVDYMTRGYIAMVNYFKNTLYPKDTSKNYYLSAAPQCVVPDAHFATVMKSAWFDFMFIQFYNTARCSARAGINHAKGVGQYDMSFERWDTYATSLNQNIRFYMGLPGSAKAVPANPGDYVNPAEAQSLIKRFFGRGKFGGVMIWEATYDYTNTGESNPAKCMYLNWTLANMRLVCNRPFGGIMKDILKAVSAGTTVNTSNCGGTIAKRSTRAERREAIAAA